MSQANLALLPVELLEEIISHLLDFTYNPEACARLGGALSLRLVCRQLEFKTRHRFYTFSLHEWSQIYQRRGYTKFDVGNYLSLQTFSSSTKLGVISASICEIDFHCSIFSQYVLDLLARYCGECDMMLLHEAPDDPSSWSAPHPFGDVCLNVVYRNLLCTHEWARATTNYDGGLLEDPFSRGMTNLKKVCLGHVEDFVFGTKLRYLDPNVKRFRGLPQQLCDEEHEVLSHVTSIIIRSLAKNSIDLETLLVQQSDTLDPSVDKGAAGMWVLDQPTETLQAFKVRKLYFQLSNGTKGPTPAGWTKQRGYDILLRALDILPNVEAFSSAPPKYEVLEPDFTSALFQRLPQRLKRFYLHDFITSSESLRTFISQRNTSLRTLSLTSAHLFADDEHWQPLLQLLHDQTPTIPKLRMGFLYELTPTGYHVLSFPPLQPPCRYCLPSGHTGQLYKGKWTMFCGGCMRYYLDLGIKGDQSVRTGLEHVFANARMETYAWSDRRPSGCCYDKVHLPLQHEQWVMRYRGLPEPDYSATMDAEGVDDWEKTYVPWMFD